MRKRGKSKVFNRQNLRENFFIKQPAYLKPLLKLSSHFNLFQKNRLIRFKLAKHFFNLLGKDNQIAKIS